MSDDTGTEQWSATDVKTRWADAMDAVIVRDAQLEITHHGRSRAVMMSWRRWERLKADLATLDARRAPLKPGSYVRSDGSTQWWDGASWSSAAPPVS